MNDVDVNVFSNNAGESWAHAVHWSDSEGHAPTADEHVARKWVSMREDRKSVV